MPPAPIFNRRINRITNNSGLCARDYVIRDNLFEECGSAQRWFANASVLITNSDGTDPLLHNILVQNNVVTDCQDRAVLVASPKTSSSTRKPDYQFKVSKFPQKPGLVKSEGGFGGEE